jgi:hypothetical protein
MFVDAGPNIRVCCDYPSRSVQVETNINPSHWRPFYTKAATFTDEEGWYQSSYAKQVTSLSVQEDIAWFWLDMKSPPPTAEIASRVSQ